jgi:diguanylate cyclase (GGDEF)-like protein/PAS domain S-box-containing protein
MLSEGVQRSWRFRIIRPDGEIRHILTTVVPTIVPGEVTCLRGIDQDITGLIDDEPLFERERAFQFVSDNIRDVVFRCSPVGEIEFVSRSIMQLLGYWPEELLGRPILELVHEDDKAEAKARVMAQKIRKQAENDGPSELRLVRKNGTKVWIEGSVRLVFDSNENLIGWVDVVRDITARRASDARVEYMACHDALTRLPNRAVLDEHLARQLEDCSTTPNVAVLCLDLDRFKTVNDTLGHQVGDQLLRDVASRLQISCSKYGGFVSRLGGDEFVAILSNATKDQVESLAQDMIESVSGGYQIEGQRVDVGLSVGVAFSPEDASDAPGLLRAGDVALYRAKAEGRGVCCRFERRMDESRQARRLMEIELRQAVANNDFELFYQPIVDIATGETLVLEALLRWRSKQGEMVLPSSFISIAEETGLIVPLGEWALREACSVAASWPDRVRVAVNLSPVQLRRRGLVATVISALEQSGLAAERLELEITEGALLGEDEVTIESMHQLKSLGIRIVLDDFGTGYSSLGYLQRFPFDKLKIDGSFVRNLRNGDEGRAIVRAVIALATALKMVTTAEGVETEGQLRVLREEGCAEVQGYLLSPPIRGHAVAFPPGRVSETANAQALYNKPAVRLISAVRRSA